MNTQAQHSRWFRPSAPAMLVTAAVLAAFAPACRKAAVTEAGCRDREAHVNKNAPKGVDEETLVVCGGHKVRWREKNQEDWKIHFDVSPFTNGVKDIKKGDADPGQVAPVVQDTAFKYSITVDGRTIDPQIIVMGGGG